MTNAGINHMGAFFFFGQKLHHVFFLNICQANTEIILAVKISNVGINLADAFFS